MYLEKIFKTIINRRKQRDLKRGLISILHRKL